MSKLLNTTILQKQTQLVSNPNQYAAQFFSSIDWNTLVSFSPLSILLVDTSNKIIQVNANFCRFTDYYQEELLSMNLADISPDFSALLSPSEFNREIHHFSDLAVSFYTKSNQLKYGKVSTLPTAVQLENKKVAHLFFITEVDKWVKENNKLELQISEVERKGVTDAMTNDRSMNRFKSIKDQLKVIRQKIHSYEAMNDIDKLLSRMDSEIREMRSGKMFLQYFENVCPSFSQNLILECPALTASEVKHCVYIYMQLSPFEVAQILGINKKSVEMARYRVKKKLGLQRKESLRLFLNQITDKQN